MRKLLQLRFTFILVPAIILLLVFLSGFTGKTASADMSGQHTMESYENVLIKSGDTLSSLADTYAEKYSNLSKAEYEEAIISLNSLPSENIHAGGYLLLPMAAIPLQIPSLYLPLRKR